jgi:hypothetical protein
MCSHVHNLPTLIFIFLENPVDVKSSVLSETCLENEINNMSCNPALTKHLQQQVIKCSI